MEYSLEIPMGHGASNGHLLTSQDKLAGPDEANYVHPPHPFDPRVIYKLYQLEGVRWKLKNSLESYINHLLTP